MCDKNVEGFRVLASYFEYENNVFWKRAHFFLIALTILLWFAATSLIRISPETPYHRLVILLVASGAGLFLANIGWTALQQGEKWISHWEGRLHKLEEKALGDVLVLRPDSDGNPELSGAKKTAYDAIVVFMVSWALSIAYVAVMIICKIFQCR